MTQFIRVKPQFKKNSSLEVGNYRPISILSIVSKILERSVYKQLVEFLQENKMLYHLGTQHDTFIGSEIVLFTDTNWTLSVRYDSNQSTDCTPMTFSNAKGLYTGMIMLDLQKAVDTVDHNILCSKLKVMGVQSVDWFESYLTDRSVNSLL
jgi:hypothetical protein